MTMRYFFLATITMFADWFNHCSKKSNGNKMIVKKKNRVEFAEEEPTEHVKMGIFNLYFK